MTEEGGSKASREKLNHGVLMGLNPTWLQTHQPGGFDENDMPRVDCPNAGQGVHVLAQDIAVSVAKEETRNLIIMSGSRFVALEMEDFSFREVRMSGWTAEELSPQTSGSLAIWCLGGCTKIERLQLEKPWELNTGSQGINRAGEFLCQQKGKNGLRVLCTLSYLLIQKIFHHLRFAKRMPQTILIHEIKKFRDARGQEYNR
ncbi:hypothetical protein TURU_121747 [Turdus rufiventris]|nr:hypothetical protein TURU_121747 [Turdus rufiventris]